MRASCPHCRSGFYPSFLGHFSVAKFRQSQPGGYGPGGLVGLPSEFQKINKKFSFYFYFIFILFSKKNQKPVFKKPKWQQLKLGLGVGATLVWGRDKNGIADVKNLAFGNPSPTSRHNGKKSWRGVPRTVRQSRFGTVPGRGLVIARGEVSSPSGTRLGRRPMQGSERTNPAAADCTLRPRGSVAEPGWAGGRPALRGGRDCDLGNRRTAQAPLAKRLRKNLG